IWLDDTEVILTHRRSDKVKLSDVYVACDMEFTNYSGKDDVDLVTSDAIYASKGYYLISGEEQQGKTSLLKNAYKNFLMKEIQPIYIDAKDIKSAELSKALTG
ncbi:TPA: toll-Interleukin receptor, partial [Yersinia enterocolitica]|nr:toll-Interleukin receptor [Yersinia enterocolitica]